MNKIWTFIVVVSLFYALITNRIDNIMNVLYEIPKNTLKLTITIGAMLIIWNSIFKIAVNSKIIFKFVKPLRKLIQKIFSEITDLEIIDLISLNIVANMLGLGMAATPISINVLEKMKDSNQINQSMFKLILINIATVTLFPSSVLALLNNYQSKLTSIIWIAIIIETIVMFSFSLIIIKLINKDIYEC